jgi:uncharacterized membrane protein
MSAGNLTPIPVPQPPSVPVGRETPNDNDRLMAALSYVFTVILPLVILLTEGKNREFQRYHAIQSLGLAAVAVIYEIVINIVVAAIASASCFLGCILWVLPLLAWVPFFYFAYQAYQGQYIEIPYLTQFMKQQNWLK